MRAVLGSIVVSAMAVLGCGGGDDGGGGGGGGGCTPGNSASITVSASGLSPRAVCVRPGGSVTLTNSDTVAHDFEGGSSCTQLNLDPIGAGQSATVTFPTAAVCTFFDAAHQNEAAFQGTIAVTTGRVEGPGY